MARKRPSNLKRDPSAGGKRAAAGPELGAEAPADAETAPPGKGLRGGIEVLSAALRTLPGTPGVYRMLDRRGEALYVGKARNLKKRVTAYTQPAKLPRRLQRMVAETARLEVVTTHTEVEALLLESNLIKRLRPRFNVLLRDDKSFPYILLTGNHAFPQIVKHRGQHERQGDYFGPFASAGAVNRTITALEKAFLLRSCSDAVFAARARPCLLYQIKRCSAPCVGKVGAREYAALVGQARDFLTGRPSDIQGELAEAMQDAAERRDFEAAAIYRDRIRALAQIQAHQDINVAEVGDADVIAAHQEGGQTAIQVFFFRAGRNYGNRAYFPSHDKQLGAAEVLGAFLAQFYDDKTPPKEVLLSQQLEERVLLAEALSIKAGRQVRLSTPARGARRSLVANATENAREALARRMAESSSQQRLLSALAEIFVLEEPPRRIEVYDNSHIQGGNAYGAMIVAGPEGFQKNAYRKFAIREAPASDDYAMMREVLGRRFTRALKEDPTREGEQWPDLVLIDGGLGQLNAALEILRELELSDLPIAAIAKGPERNAGRERIFLPERPPLMLEPRDPLLYYLQRLRDEAHRFAIGSHRAGRGRTRLVSALDAISGIGAKRKRALLLHFGSARAVERAGLEDLEAVEGISKAVARKIYDHFHGSA